MDKAKSLFYYREGSMKKLKGKGAEILCVLGGIEKSVRSRGGRKIWL